jgi:hydrogenase maturation protease
MSSHRLLVLGLGNVLLSDEGVGVRIVERLTDAPAGSLPAGIELVDGGTLGLELLPLLDGVDAVLLLDALDTGAAPGSVAVLRDDELRARMGGAISVHQLGVGDLLAVARLRGTLPARTSLIGIQPERLEVGLALSPSVAAAVPMAIRLAQQEIASLCEVPDA